MKPLSHLFFYSKQRFQCQVMGGHEQAAFEHTSLATGNTTPAISSPRGGCS